MVSRAARDFESRYRLIRSDIFEFCRALNFEPTWMQRAVLLQVMLGNGHPNYMAIKSGQGTGKTTLAVVACLWRAIQFPGAMVVLTAPTMRQCRDVFLAEARRLIANADPALRRIIDITGSRIDIMGGRQGPCKMDWGVMTVTATDPRNAQGYHHLHLTIMFEEFSGIPREIVTQFKGTATNEDMLMMGIGNPNLRDCAMFDCFNMLRDEWWPYTINAEDVARDYPHILRASIHEGLAREFGRESDVYRIRVLGEFPFQDPDCVVGSEILEMCSDPKLLLPMSQLARDEGGVLRRARQFGTDFARYGGDEATIYQRLGNSIIDWWAGSHVDPNKVVNRSFQMQVGSGWSNESTTFVSDAGGMGQGVMQNYYDASKWLLEFHNNGAPSDPQYENMITEAWFNVARLARQHKLYIPRDQRLIQQLSGRRYTTNKKGKLVLWTKDEYMREGNDSPDRAEGCVMALYDAVVAGGRHVRQQSPRKIGSVVR